MRLRSGKTGSGKGAGHMIAGAIATARSVGAAAQILVRGDSAYGTRKVVRACLRAGAEFSLVMTKNSAITKAIATIDENAWTPVQYPNAVRDPGTGAWISDAEVAEIPYTAFAFTKDRTTARLVVRRVKDARYLDAPEPVWRHHPFFTNSVLPTVEADLVHRKHAIIETVFADLIDGPLAHIPSGSFGTNSAWVLCAAIAHNLLRATGILAGGRYGRARGATLRRRSDAVPARLARPQRRPVLHLPSYWPYASRWLQCGTTRSDIRLWWLPEPVHLRRCRLTSVAVEKLGRPVGTACPQSLSCTPVSRVPASPASRWIQAKSNTVQLGGFALR